MVDIFLKVVQYGFTKNAGFSVFSYDIQFMKIFHADFGVNRIYLPGYWLITMDLKYEMCEGPPDLTMCLYGTTLSYITYFSSTPLNFEALWWKSALLWFWMY